MNAFALRSREVGGVRFLPPLGSLAWPLLLIPFAIFCIGAAMLYSLAAGDAQLWAVPTGIKFAAGFLVFLVVSFIDIRFWQRWAAVPYLGALVLLLVVAVWGEVRGGGQRWLSLGSFQLQPSELMKIALVVALASLYSSDAERRQSRLWMHLLALILIAVPALLVFRQPDLGTSALLAITGLSIVFLSGISLWAVGAGIGCVGGMVAFVWKTMGTDLQILADYQYQRILEFLGLLVEDPARVEISYQLKQSLIAMGSGGMWGVGYMQGTQSHLLFLPERHTDFIFAALAEELGLAGGLAVLLLYGLLLACLAWLAFSARDMFSRLLASGAVVMLFGYVAVNTGMVMGLLPIVGVPLPFLSYGGSSLLAVMIALGLAHSAHIAKVASRKGDDMGYGSRW